MSEKYVSIDRKNSKKEVYHVDRECTRIRSNVRVVADSEIAYHDLTMCKWCDPEIEHPNAQYEQDHSYHKALKDAAKEYNE